MAVAVAVAAAHLRQALLKKNRRADLPGKNAKIGALNVLKKQFEIEELCKSGRCHGIQLAIFRSRATKYQLCATLGAPEHVPNTSGRRAKTVYKTKWGSF